ncbi:hypothetical protein KUL25_11250 [Rhodobacteraceae bacterium N5(2021)]|uniref:Uncharacterized protein n=1 Tax=Gymnodinialimonas phycosphaerae TaxID=2841589 RepID=A0A975TR92_9RHOB|nr:hypothetical protein [Gymnodinialimonas phycosphaerae]
MTEATAERLRVFAGPVLAYDDPVFVGVDNIGTVNVRILRAYWKIIAAQKAGTVQNFGLLLEQDLADVDSELRLTTECTRRLTSLSEMQDRIDVVTCDPY